MKLIRCLLLILLFAFSTSAFAKPVYIRGTILHFFGDPGQDSDKQKYQVLDDGLLIINNGKIEKIGPWFKLKHFLPKQAKVDNYPDQIILPGFVDTHVHYAQLDIIAADNGGHLMNWLKTYNFPNEKKFQDPEYGRDVANAFTDELIRNGTTTANVFTTIYPSSVDALFTQAKHKHLRMIAGLVLGDTNLPHYLKQNPKTAASDTEALIKKWHHQKGTRLLYALEPRFAPTTSPEMFKTIRTLKEKYPDIYIHTHIAENAEVTEWVKKLFGAARYLDVYDHNEMLGNHTILAHGVYLSTVELDRMAGTHTHVAFCPSSNLFLGSGLFDLQRAVAAGVDVGLGTAIGSGTSFSMLKNLSDAYKIQQLNNQNLPALRGFYFATLGGAKALGLEDKVGNFEPGKDADVVVLNMKGSSPLLKRRLAHAQTLEEKLFVLMMLGDEHDILATYVAGHKAKQS